MNVKVNITELKYMLDNTPADQNIMLTGRHGIGKSEILTDYFSNLGMKVVSLFLGQMSDPGDLIGLPDKDNSVEKTVFRPPYWFPLDNEPIVLFLDELNRARPEVLQTIMDLALNRKLAGRVLPTGSRIIAAVNEGEEYQLTDLDPALVSRFNIFRFVPSVDEWILWAKKSNVDDRVVTFIKEHSMWLDKDPTLVENEDTGLDKTPDRRAWKRVSDVIKDKELLCHNDKLLISSIIGVKATNLFVSKIRQNKVVDVRKLLNDFTSVVPSLANLSVHDYGTINEDIFKFLQTMNEGKEEKLIVIKNLTKYIEYIEFVGNREVLANLAHFISDEKYSKAADFIASFMPRLYRRICTYTFGINV